MLVKPLNVIFIPAQPGIPPTAGGTVCPDTAPPGNGSGGGTGGSGGGTTSVCFFVPNLYGGMMEVCT